MDDELQKLLNEVENIQKNGTVDKPSNPDQQTIEAESTSATEAQSIQDDVKTTEATTIDSQNEIQDDFDNSLVAREAKIVSPVSDVQNNIDDPRLNKVRDDLFTLMSHVAANANTQISEFTEDRKKSEDVLDVLLTRLRSSPDNIRSAEINTIAMLLQVKAQISANRSGYIESIAKLFAALKKNDTLGSGNSGTVSRDDILKALRSDVEGP